MGEILKTFRNRDKKITRSVSRKTGEKACFLLKNGVFGLKFRIVYGVKGGEGSISNNFPKLVISTKKSSEAFRRKLKIPHFPHFPYRLYALT